MGITILPIVVEEAITRLAAVVAIATLLIPTNLLNHLIVVKEVVKVAEEKEAVAEAAEDAISIRAPYSLLARILSKLYN